MKPFSQIVNTEAPEPQSMHREIGHHPNTSNIIIVLRAHRDRKYFDTTKNSKLWLVSKKIASRIDAVWTRTPCSVELKQKTPEEQDAKNNENRDDDDFN